jgi:hypothetical protein
MSSVPSDPDETGEGAAVRPPRISLGKGRALVPVPVVPEAPGLFASLTRSHGYVAAGVAVVMGLGFVAGTEVFASKPKVVTVAKAGPPPDTTMDVLVRVQGEVRALKSSLDGLKATAENSRQDDSIRGLKRSVDTLKGDLETVKTASSAAVGQLGAKIDRLDRDPGPKLAEIAARLDKLDRDPSAKLNEVASRLDRMDPSAKLADVTARLERIERQVATADVTGSIPPQAAVPAKAPMPPQRMAPVAAASPVTAVPPTRPEPSPAKPEAAKSETVKAEVAKPEAARPEPAPRAEAPARQQEAAARPATVEGWMLRDVYGGVALLEGRAGGLREVAPGEFVPGVGEIRSIERRGRGWVVVTSRGIIQADARW